jgi:hypothetical protein
VLADRIEKNVTKETGIEKKLYIYIMTFASELNKNQDVAAMLMREMSNSGEDMPIKALAQMLRTFKILTAILEKGIEEKVFKCMEPMLIQMMIVGSLSFLIKSQKVRHKIKKELDSEAQTVVDFTIVQAGEKIAKMVLNSLKHGEEE